MSTGQIDQQRTNAARTPTLHTAPTSRTQPATAIKDTHTHTHIVQSTFPFVKVPAQWSTSTAHSTQKTHIVPPNIVYIAAILHRSENFFTENYSAQTCPRNAYNILCISMEVDAYIFCAMTLCELPSPSFGGGCAAAHRPCFGRRCVRNYSVHLRQDLRLHSK